MSFRCDRCKRYEAGKPVKVVVETREVQHTQRYKDDYDNLVVVNTGVGSQIVREESVCSPHCGQDTRR
jgi:hypothetical protein